MTYSIQKRQTPRVDLSVTVHAQVQSRLQQFYSKNISQGGIYLEVSDASLKAGEVIALSFSIPQTSQTVKVEGEITHIRPFTTLDENSGQNVERFGVGIKFINLTPQNEQLIATFISGKDVRTSH